MPEFVRVKDPDTGHEFTTSAAFAERVGLTPLSGKDTVDVDGKPLPPKLNVPKGTSPASKEGSK